jgi:hypothetical protein
MNLMNQNQDRRPDERHDHRPDHDRPERVNTNALPVPHSHTPMRERDHGPIHPPAAPRELPEHPAMHSPAQTGACRHCDDRAKSGDTAHPSAPDRDRAPPADAPNGGKPPGKDQPWTPRPSGAQVPTDALKHPTDDEKADVASLESFPASDPPSHGGTT